MFLLFFIPFFLLFFRFIPVRFSARTHRVSGLASLWRGDLVDDKRWKIVSRCLVIVSNDEQQGRSSLSSRRRNWFWIYSPESGETIRFCFRDESSVSIPRHDPSTVRYFYTLLSLLPENWRNREKVFEVFTASFVKQRFTDPPSNGLSTQIPLCLTRKWHGWEISSPRWFSKRRSLFQNCRLPGRV